MASSASVCDNAPIESERRQTRLADAYNFLDWWFGRVRNWEDAYDSAEGFALSAHILRACS